MHIVLTGLNHKTAPLEIRERVSFPKERLPDALAALSEEVGEGVILWTCNRTEVYVVSDEPSATTAEIRRYVTGQSGLGSDALDPYLYDRTDLDATLHLFKVASGLDSMILGEFQILGQVRDALTAASEHASLRVPASRLFHRAIRTGRRVRDETEVSRNALSVSYAGVQLVEKVLGGVRGLRVLLIGAGEAGQLVAKALHTSGAGDLVIANRTLARAEEMQRQLGGRVMPYDRLTAALTEVDVAITATEAPEYVLSRDAVGAAVSSRDSNDLFLLDLSVPRNIDPETGAVDGVRLFNIDDLSSIAEQNLAGRQEAAVDATRIVEEEATSFMKWWESREAVPVIRALRDKGESIRQREMKRGLRKMSSLSPDQVEVVDAMTRSIVTKLLHDPTKRLKKRSDDDYLDAARDLFQLWDDEAPGPQPKG